MSKTLLTLFVMAAVSCGEGPPRHPTTFRTSLDVEAAGAQRTFLIGLDDPERWHNLDQMAVAGNFLYFNVPWSGVYRMPKYGGEIHPIEQADGVEDFRGIATNDTDLYWARLSDFGSAGPDFPHSRLRRQPLGGGATQTVTEGDIAFDGSVFHAAADAFYAAVYYPLKDYADLTRFPVDGGTSTVLRRLGFPDPNSAPVPTSGFVFDDLFAYFSSCDPNWTACVLTRFDLRTGARDTLPTSGGPQQVVAVDATDLYLVSTHQILRRSKDGAGDTTVLATFAENMGPVPITVVDDEEVFLIANRGSLVAVPKAGGPPRTLTTGLERTNTLTQDEQNIFVMYDWMSIDIVPKSRVSVNP